MTETDRQPRNQHEAMFVSKNTDNLTIDRLYRCIDMVARRRGVITIVVERIGYPDEPGGRVCREVSTETVSEFADNCLGWQRDDSRHSFWSAHEVISADADVPSFINFLSNLEDNEWGHSKVFTVEGWAAEEKQRERKACEEAATALAQRSDSAIGTMEFITALEAEIERVDCDSEEWNGGEIRAEQWAAHMHNGTSDVYFDDLNFENGRFQNRRDEFERVRNYLDRHCPLLMAEYRESKLVEAASA